MTIDYSFRVVIDTNVVFEGLTKQGGAVGLVIDAWLAGLCTVHVSNALSYEYVDVYLVNFPKNAGKHSDPFWVNC